MKDENESNDDAEQTYEPCSKTRENMCAAGVGTRPALQARARLKCIEGGSRPPSAVTKRSTAREGKACTCRARLRTAHGGRPSSPETRAKLAICKLKTPTAVTLAKMRAAQKSGAEIRAKRQASIAREVKRLTAKHRTGVSAANKGKTLSPEARAKLSAAQKRNPRD